MEEKISAEKFEIQMLCVHTSMNMYWWLTDANLWFTSILICAHESKINFLVGQQPEEKKMVYIYFRAQTNIHKKAHVRNKKKQFVSTISIRDYTFNSHINIYRVVSFNPLVIS